MEKLTEALGWYGVIAIISAYALVSFSVFSATSIWYQLLNATGAIGIAVISFRKQTYQPGILNIVWALIALFAMVRIFVRS
jgi:uncharacterized membrane protein